MDAVFPMKHTTKGGDLLNGLKWPLLRYKLKLKNLSSIVTGGAPLVALFKK